MPQAKDKSVGELFQSAIQEVQILNGEQAASGVWA